MAANGALIAILRPRLTENSKMTKNMLDLTQDELTVLAYYELINRPHPNGLGIDTHWTKARRKLFTEGLLDVHGSTFLTPAGRRALEEAE